MNWSPDPQSLRGCVAVVTGATRGAGRGIAAALGEAGATVICTGRSTQALGSSRSDYDRPETIEETAELVTRTRKTSKQDEMSTLRATGRLPRGWRYTLIPRGDLPVLRASVVEERDPSAIQLVEDHGGRNGYSSPFRGVWMEV